MVRYQYGLGPSLLIYSPHLKSHGFLLHYFSMLLRSPPDGST